MKSLVLIAGLAIVLVNVAALIPATAAYASYAPMVSAAIGIWLIGRIALAKSVNAPAGPASSQAAPEAVKARPAAALENQAEREVVALLGVFQEKGRLIDFLMDDIGGYSDAQVGSAARVVHEGCRKALKEHFAIAPVSEAAEGSAVTVPEDAAKSDYRLSGKVEGSGPFSGTLAHKGWKAESVKLPRFIKGDGGRLPAIAPAQVEVK